jgi:hypothetical protein
MNAPATAAASLAQTSAGHRFRGAGAAPCYPQFCHLCPLLGRFDRLGCAPDGDGNRPPARECSRGAKQLGGSVILRVGVLAATALTCAGCANERPGSSFYHQASWQPSSSVPSAGADVDAAVESDQPATKTMGAKVLTAIALERVTGRRPDPARLAEAY